MLVRTVVSQPFTVRFGASDQATINRAARHVLTASLSLAVLFALPLGVLAFTAPGSRPLDRLMVLALVVVVFQDAWRQILVVDQRCQAAFFNDASWAVTQGAILVVVASTDSLSPFVAVAAWAAGGAVGALIGFAQTHLLPARRGSYRWVLDHAYLWRGLLLESTGVILTEQVPIYLIGIIAGLTEVASYRGALTVLAAYALLLQAPFAVLPEIVRLRYFAPQRIPRMLWLYGGTLVTIAVLYTCAALILPEAIGTALLGETWEIARPLLAPVGAVLAVLGALQAASVGLRAVERTTEIGVIRLGMAPTTLVVVTIGAYRGGARGAALCLLGALILTTLISWRACRRALALDQERRRTVALRVADGGRDGSEHPGSEPTGSRRNGAGPDASRPAPCPGPTPVTVAGRRRHRPGYLRRSTSGSGGSMDLRFVVRSILRRWPLVLAGLLLGGIVGQLLGSHRTVASSAEAMIQIQPDDPLEGLVPGPAPPTADPARLVASQIEVVSSPVVLDEAARRLDMATEDLHSDVRVSTVSGSNLIRVQTAGTTEERAVREAETVVDTYLDQRRTARASELTTARRSLDRDIDDLTAQLDAAQQSGGTALATALASRYAELLGQRDGVDRELDLGRDVVDVAVPAHPVVAQASPLPTGVVGAVLGGLVGVVVAYTWPGRGRRSRLPAGLVAGRLSAVKGPVASNSLVVGQAKAGRTGAEMRELWSSVSGRLAAGDVTRLSVTSTGGHCRGQFVAFNLAEAAASEGRPTLVVVSAQAGGQLPSAWLPLVTSSSGHDGEAPPSPTANPYVDVLIADFPPPDLPLAELEDRLAGAVTGYDLVVLVAPPISLGQASLDVVAQSDACLVFSAPEEEEPLLLAIQRIRANDVSVLGVVVADLRVGPPAAAAEPWGGDAEAAAAEPMDELAFDEEETGNGQVEARARAANRWSSDS
jgi:hypothetical protein